MASSTTLTFSGTGAHLRQLGTFNSTVDEKPTKHFGFSCCKTDRTLSYKQRFWNCKNLNFKSKNKTLTSAMGKEAEDSFLSNAGGDADEMFDDLLEKYGKVVFRRSENKSVSAEVDDDAQSLSFAVEVAKVASDVKAADVRVLFVKPLVYWTRFFVIATAFSRPQIDAIGSKIRDLAEQKYGKIPTGDSKPNSWTLLDFGDVVIHIFLPQQRELYNLEEFYGNATPIKLSFGDQPPFRR